MTTVMIDALLDDGRSALTDLQGASPGGQFVTSLPAHRSQITPGDVVRYGSPWLAVIGTTHDAVLGVTWLALIDASGIVTRHMMVASDVIDRRTDVTIIPDTLYKLIDRSAATRYVSTAPGAAGGRVDDEQLSAWIEQEHGTSLDAGTITDLRDLHRLAGAAVRVLDANRATHPIRDVAVWPLDDGGTGEALVTVDHPAGIRLASFTIRPQSFTGHTYREALADLLAMAGAQAGRLDALMASTARLWAPDGPAAGPAPRPACLCPADAQVKIGDILVTGHTGECAIGEPRRYVWQESGSIGTGTLADYTQCWAMAHDDSLPGADLGQELRTWDASFQVTAESLAGAPDRDGCWLIRLSVPGEQVTVRVWANSEPAPPARAVATA